MLTIRNNTFETNSSSSHSLVISSTGYSKKDYQIPLDENNNLVLDGDNFSQHKIYVKTTYSKIVLCMMLCMVFDNFNDSKDKYVENFTNFLLEKTEAKNIVNNIVFGKNAFITSDIWTHYSYGDNSFFEAIFDNQWDRLKYEEFQIKQIIENPILLEQFIFGETTLYTETTFG